MALKVVSLPGDNAELQKLNSLTSRPRQTWLCITKCDSDHTTVVSTQQAGITVHDGINL